MTSPIIALKCSLHSTISPNLTAITSDVASDLVTIDTSCKYSIPKQVCAAAGGVEARALRIPHESEQEVDPGKAPRGRADFAHGDGGAGLLYALNYMP